MEDLFPGFTQRRIAARGAEIDLVTGGSGPPLLLLHGYPQTRAMWHKIAGGLARHFTVVASDLRGYGRSSKPQGDAEHLRYSKREMAADQVEVMRALGFERFFLAGHDRGARVGHRLALDHAERVLCLALLDIIPTAKVFSSVDRTSALAYYHWFFLSQPFDLPERLIGGDPGFYLDWTLGGWGTRAEFFDPRALADYRQAYLAPGTIHAMCEDYRAGASIDLAHDAADQGAKVRCPLLALWGARNLTGRRYDVLACWRERAEDVRGRALDAGHFLAEERPDEVLSELLAFFGEG